jgi:hypothetical protein
MADEDGAGANYLAGLRQSTAPQAAGAARAPSQGGPGSVATQPAGVAPAGTRNSGSADKRGSPRYKCAGSARIQEISTTVSTWASFADISLLGCYVETATPLRVGAALTLRLEANGFRVEANGEVRVLYPGLGMGVSFGQMSPENRERLRELVHASAPALKTMGPRIAQRSAANAPPEALPVASDPATVLLAMRSFFEDRHVMGREEFLRILRKHQ